jgi:hypothetical protein
MERPRARKRLSSAEVALLEFLARGGKRRRKRKAPTDTAGAEVQAAA